ncbi:MAG: hypothetical protein ABI837_16035 [Acidobacteriota bacterium]
MSLRIFHIIFIVVSVLLCLFVGGWGIRQYALEHDASSLLLSGIFLLCGAGLVVYGSRVYRKLKEL